MLLETQQASGTVFRLMGILLFVPWNDYEELESGVEGRSASAVTLLNSGVVVNGIALHLTVML